MIHSEIFQKGWIDNVRFYLIPAVFFALTAMFIPFLISKQTIHTTVIVYASLLTFPLIFRMTNEMEEELRNVSFMATTVVTWIVVGAVTLVLGMFFIPIMILIPSTRFRLMFIGSAVIIYCFGVRVKHIGSLPKKGGRYIICPNHTSFLDYFLSTYIMGWKGKYTVVHGSNLHNIPIIGTVMRKWLISVNRADSKTFFPMINQMRKALEDGYNVLIYPEGGRKTEAETDSGIRLKKFKPGAFNVACDIGCEIVPVTIIGADKFKPKDSKRWWLQPGPVNIVFHDPISPVGLLPNELSRKTSEAILSALF